MPHCDCEVYEELLTDMLRSSVSCFFLFGNELSNYSSDGLRCLLAEYKRVERLEIVESFGVRHDVFNDCTLYKFNKLS